MIKSFNFDIVYLIKKLCFENAILFKLNGVVRVHVCLDLHRNLNTIIIHFSNS